MKNTIPPVCTSLTEETKDKTEASIPERDAETHSVKRSVVTSSIIPVWVSSVEDPDNECLTYALLDTQSDTSFILEDLGSQWSDRAKQVKLRISTMTSPSMLLNSKRIDGLQVRGMKTSDRITLPPVYTKDYIPVERSHVPTRETALQWPHLKPIAVEMGRKWGN